MGVYQRIKDIKINIIFLVLSAIILGVDFSEYMQNGGILFLVSMIMALVGGVGLLIFLFYDLHKLRETLKKYEKNLKV